MHYYFLEGGMDVDALFEVDGTYWYVRGWNPVAVVSWTIGTAFAVLAPVWTVPALSSAFVAGGIYYVLDALSKPRSNSIRAR